MHHCPTRPCPLCQPLDEVERNRVLYSQLLNATGPRVVEHSYGKGKWYQSLPPEPIEIPIDATWLGAENTPVGKWGELCYAATKPGYFRIWRDTNPDETPRDDRSDSEKHRAIMDKARLRAGEYRF